MPALLKFASYGSSITVTRVELYQQPVNAFGLKYLEDSRRRFEIADAQDRELAALFERRDRERAEYPAKLAAWKTYRANQCDAFEARITAGYRPGPDDIKRFVDHVWSSKPIDPDAETGCALPGTSRQRAGRFRVDL